MHWNAWLMGLVGMAALATPDAQGGTRVQDGVEQGASEDEARLERIEAARTALGQASALRRSSNGKDASERFEILTRTGTQYEHLARSYADVPVAAGEAWFRAGEIWRTLRRNEQAATCFQHAVDAAGSAEDPGGAEAADAKEGAEFGARAQLELGHMSRRAKHLDVAVERYALVETRFAAQRRQGVQARTWRGKVEIQRENLEVGHRLLLSVSKDYPEYPVEHVRNADLVAVAWCKAGRTAEARELVDSVRKRHGSTPEGEEVDEALTSALTRMKAPALLARAEEEDQDR